MLPQIGQPQGSSLAKQRSEEAPAQGQIADRLQLLIGDSREMKLAQGAACPRHSQGRVVGID